MMKNIPTYRSFFLLLVSVAVFSGTLLHARPAKAQTMTEVQKLDFGTFGVVNNNGSYTIVIGPDNSVTYDPSGKIVSDGAHIGHRGVYALAGFPPNMQLTLGVTTTNNTTTGGVTLTNGSSLTYAGNPAFSIGSFTANNPLTDASGNATLYIGATLTTSGSGTNYMSGTYNGSVDITLYF